MRELNLRGAGIYSAEHGQVLDGNATRLAEILHDYDQAFELQFIPANAGAGTLDKPYRVVDNTNGMRPSIVGYYTHAEMLEPHKILARIVAGDTKHQSIDDILARAEAEEAAKRLFRYKERQEALAEAADLVAFRVSGGRNKLHTTKHAGVKIGR